MMSFTIETSTRSKTGLKGVTQDPKFAGGKFIAYFSRTEALALDNRLTQDFWPWGGSTMVHIGYFDTVTEAMMARAMFKAEAGEYLDVYDWAGGRDDAGCNLPFVFPSWVSM